MGGRKNNLKIKNNNKKKAQQWRKSGKDSPIEKQTKLLLLVLSNSSKILRLSLLSTPDVIYIPDEPSKKRQMRTKTQHFRSLFSMFLCLLIPSLFSPANPRELARQEKRHNSDRDQKHISKQHRSFHKSSSSDIASLLAHHQMLHLFCVKICAAAIFIFPRKSSYENGAVYPNSAVCLVAKQLIFISQHPEIFG